MRIESLESLRYRPKADELLIIKAAHHAEMRTAVQCWNEWQHVQNLDTAPWAQVQLATLTGSRLPKESVGRLLPRLAGIRRAIWTQGSVRLHKADPFLRKFQTAGISPLLLKGAARVAKNRNVLAERSFADIDALFHAADWKSVTEIIFAGKYSNIWNLDRIDVEYRLRNTHHSMAVKVAEGMEVDLHQSSLLLNRQKGMDDGLWARSSEGKLGNIAVRLPAPADLLAITLGHAFLYTDQPNFNWIGDALDCISADNFDWRLFEEIIANRELHVHAWVGLDFLRSELAAKIPDDILEMLKVGAREPFVSEFKAFRLRSPLTETRLERKLLEAEHIRASKSANLLSAAKLTRQPTEFLPAERIAPNTYIVPTPSKDAEESALSIVIELQKNPPLTMALRSFDFFPIEFARWTIEPGTVSFGIDRKEKDVSAQIANVILEAREISFLKIVIWPAAHGSPSTGDPELDCKLRYQWWS